MLDGDIDTIKNRFLSVEQHDDPSQRIALQANGQSNLLSSPTKLHIK